MIYPLSHKLSVLDGRYQKCVLQNIEMLLSCILVSRTVNLNKLKDDLPNVLKVKNLKPLSCYKKLLRCVEMCSPSRLWLDLLIWGLSHVWGVIHTLHIDGTEWSFGTYNIHVLVLSADFQGIAIPVFFKTYRHKGVLSETDRINFMKKALRYHDLSGKTLLADREFIGDKWLCFLNEQGIKFIIRLRKQMYKNTINAAGQDEGRSSKNAFTVLDSYEKLKQRALKKGYAQTRIYINKQEFRVEFWKNKHHQESVKDPIIFLITNILDKNRVGKKYQQRWKIEYCFKHLKSNGFDIEDIGFKKIHKIQFIIAVVIVIYILAICQGLIADKKNKTKSKWKQYKNGLKTRAISIFRQGLFVIKTNIANIFHLRKFLIILKPAKNAFLQSVQ